VNGISQPAWDGTAGTAGGPHFGAALRRAMAAKEFDPAQLAAEANLDPAFVAALADGSERATSAQLARIARALRLRAIEFLRQTDLLSLEVYAAGLDPLYFLPAGPVRFDARIYMREINPRHAVPERDMLARNPLLAALEMDTILDPIGKLELELTYLLRAAIQQTGGVL
jgi:transcriptional regulator with XRE-family HTH domain